MPNPGGLNPAAVPNAEVDSAVRDEPVLVDAESNRNRSDSFKTLVLGGSVGVVDRSFSRVDLARLVGCFSDKLLYLFSPKGSPIASYGRSTAPLAGGTLRDWVIYPGNDPAYLD